MALELISFRTGANWISKLWSRLKGIRKTQKAELDAINDIIFCDPLETAQYYVEPDCQERNPADRDEEDFLVSREPMFKKVDEFFRGKIIRPGYNQMFILSDAGMGKTALLTMLKLMHLTSFWPRKTNCVLKKLGPETTSEISALSGKRETILLLDSLDEDPAAYGRVRERLVDILYAAKPFKRVIITCRTQFFPEVEKDPLERLGLVTISGFTCPVKYLSLFSEDKVNAYLAKRFPKRFGLLPDKKRIAEAQQVIETMGSLRCRPMLLAYIEDLMASPIIQGRDSEFKVYDALLMNWLHREKRKAKDIGVQDLLDACIIVATQMQIKRQRSISEAKLDRLIEAIAAAKPIKRIEVKGRSLLNRNSEGDYRFSHYSIQEFLVAKLLFEKPVFQPKYPIPITDFIFRMIALSKKRPNFPRLIDCSGLQLKDADFSGMDLDGFTFCQSNLCGSDFSGAALRGANFEGANLERCSFKKAVLSGAVFTGTRISGASFNGACIESTEFERMHTEDMDCSGIRLRNANFGMKFVYIPAGSFTMGSPPNEKGRSKNEISHPVSFRQGFFLQSTPVTQGQWQTIMGKNPSRFQDRGEKRPVETVSWHDAHEFITKLNQLEDTDKYRLPTEAEWEYACRAGTKTAFHWGYTPDCAKANYGAGYSKECKGQNPARTSEVASYPPNAWGLYDMHGNVWEWCQDWYDPDYYRDSPENDPQGPSSGSSRVVRGGGWGSRAVGCRSAIRGRFVPGGRYFILGFRLARSLP